ncbi:MAG: acyl-CoA synthetase [Acidimicrobiales bacterium]
MTLNLADLFEVVADAVPDRVALVTDRGRFSYAQLEERSNRLAAVLAAAGVGPGDHVGLMLVNGTEYVEGMIAAFKLRAVPINVNYRYVEGELRYLFTDADLVALVVHAQFTPQVARVAADVPLLRTVLVVDDGSASQLPDALAYEKALAGADPGRPDGSARSGDDIYCAYTGGTTGMPKGVLWRHEDIFFASLGGGDPTQMGNVISDSSELPSRILDQGLVAVCTPPFMHVSGHWLVFSTLYGGGSIVVPPAGRFEPAAIWDLVTAERVNLISLVGDAMARPLLDAYEAAEPGRIDASSLFVVASGGAILSPATKDRIATVLPNVIVVDGFGSSETGVVGSKSSFSGGGPDSGPRFTVNDQTAVLDGAGRAIPPGSDAIGRLARRGHIPLGYYNDAEKTAATFLTVDGVRWVLPGDMARVGEDGTVILLGRGSVSINTGGEKVFPEEVEAALKAHPGIEDAVVVGLPDERWGERVVAVVQHHRGAHPTDEELQAFCRERIAGYKIPRQFTAVDRMVRSPSGKADYRWAKSYAGGQGVSA